MAKRDSVAGTAADPVVESVPLEIDGKTYRLFYDFNAIAEAEQAAGCNLMHGIAVVMLNGMDARQFRGLLYGALRVAHPKMTLLDAGNLIRIDTMPEIRRALVLAWNASLPEGKKIAEDPTEGGDAKAPAD